MDIDSTSTPATQRGYEDTMDRLEDISIADRYRLSRGHFVVYTQNELKPDIDLESVSDVDQYMQSDNEVIHVRHNSYATRTLFVFLIVTGIVLIGTGVGLLITCRGEINKITCGIYMDRQPCSPLATSTYLGCAVILATVFGFGCVGRKAMACLLLCILLTEVTFGIYLIVKKKSTLSVHLETGLSAARQNCDVVPNSRAEYVACWGNVASEPVCLGVANDVISRCNDTVAASNSSVVQDVPHESDEVCATALNNEVIQRVWSQLYIEGPVLIVVAPLHLLIAAWLWLMRFGQGSLKYELRLRSAVSSCLWRKMSEPAGTNTAHFESLIVEPPPPVLVHHYARMASQKYIIKKLNKQKNIYATV